MIGQNVRIYEWRGARGLAFPLPAFLLDSQFWWWRWFSQLALSSRPAGRSHSFDSCIRNSDSKPPNTCAKFPLWSINWPGPFLANFRRYDYILIIYIYMYNKHIHSFWSNVYAMHSIELKQAYLLPRCFSIHSSQWIRNKITKKDLLNMPTMDNEWAIKQKNG